MQNVSEARRRHTLALGQAPPADVEIRIKGYVRACKRGVGASAAKDHFQLRGALSASAVLGGHFQAGVSGHDYLEWVVGHP